MGAQSIGNFMDEELERVFRKFFCCGDVQQASRFLSQNSCRYITWGSLSRGKPGGKVRIRYNRPGLFRRWMPNPPIQSYFQKRSHLNPVFLTLSGSGHRFVLCQFSSGTVHRVLEDWCGLKKPLNKSLLSSFNSLILRKKPILLLFPVR